MKLRLSIPPAGRLRRAGLVAAGMGILGCSHAPAGSADSLKPGVTRRDNRLVHAPCPITGSGAEKVKVGEHPNPGMTIVREGGREACRAVDFNFDGIVDAWIYRDAQGRVTRRENDYDRDGKIDEIAIYRDGVIVEKQRATALVGHIDTWHFYRAGRITRTERDSDGDSIIDQWWEYPKPDHPECPLIHADTNGDGRPDPGSSVAVCEDGGGYVPPERASDRPKASVFDSPGESLPSEVEEKPLPPEKAGKTAPSPSTGGKRK